MPETTPPLPLRDIISPLEQGWWPPAPGWWFVAIIILLLVGFLIRALKRYFTYEYATLRTAALHELTELQQQTALDDQEFAVQLSALLKRVSIVRYAQQQPAKLSGNAWLAFLDQTNSGQAFSQNGGSALLDAQYRNATSLNRSELLRAAGAWIKAI